MWRLALLLFLLPTAVLAQPWAGILDTQRAIDWSAAGVVGGIPDRPSPASNCATFSPGATAAQVNSAIASCATNGVVYLNAGTYTFSAGLVLGRSNVTLRGAGPDQTKIIFTNDDGCFGVIGAICVRGGNQGYYGADDGGGPDNIANWTAGYAKGSTTISVSNVTGLQVGMPIYLDQLNDSSDTGGIYVCGTAGVCIEQGSTSNGRAGRGQRQLVRLMACDGNSTPGHACSSGANMVITPGVHSPNIVSGKSPSAWWGNSSSFNTGIGVEDLSVDWRSGTGYTAGNFTFIYVDNSWMKNVRSVNAPSPRQHVFLYQVTHVTVRDSYFVGTQNDLGGSENYGVNNFGSSDCLVENNIFQHRGGPKQSNGEYSGVWAYNFSIDDHYIASPTWMQASAYSHEIGNMMILHEGNVEVGIKGDLIHGTSNLFTFFRNYSIGWETGKTAQTSPVLLHANQRYWHFIGNVLGRAGYHTVYENDSSDTAIYRLGIAYGGIGADALVDSTTMRWGNYDTVTGTNRFVAGEVPSGITFFPNPVPANQNLPASFYLSSQPAWWGAMPWPPIGPDVTGGNVANVGGHVYKIPAQLCWEGMSADPAYTGDPAGIKIFTPSTCYALSDTPSVSVAATDASAAEPSGNNGLFTVSRTGDTTGALVVNCAISGTATPTDDYTAISCPVTIPDGQASVTAAVTVQNDVLAGEGTETVIFTITAAGAGEYSIGTASATVNITDDDPLVSVTATDSTAGEPANNGVFTLACDMVCTLTVNCALSGTASPGSDYTAISCPRSLVNSDTITVAVLDDGVAEVTKTVIFTITAGSGYGIGTNPAEITITDNDAIILGGGRFSGQGTLQ